MVRKWLLAHVRSLRWRLFTGWCDEVGCPASSIFAAHCLK